MRVPKRLSIFVPAYNAGRHLEQTIVRIPESIWPEVRSCWIINDGSSDRTGEIAEDLSKRNHRIRPVHFPENRGYGAVVRRGLALCREDSCEVAACLHGDGQYPPESIPEFFEAVLSDGFDILQGSRIASGTALSGGMPLYKYIAGRTLTFFENSVFGLAMTDYHSGYLFYSRRALSRIHFERLSGSFDFDLEVIASARARGMKVGELPIPTRYADEESHLKPIRYGLRVVRVMGKYLMGGYRE